eukprot:5391884-Amphidinium_carterae.1
MIRRLWTFFHVLLSGCGNCPCECHGRGLVGEDGRRESGGHHNSRSMNKTPQQLAGELTIAHKPRHTADCGHREVLETQKKGVATFANNGYNPQNERANESERADRAAQDRMSKG